MSSCPYCEQLQPWLRGYLRDELAGMLQSHVGGCESCARAAQVLRAEDPLAARMLVKTAAREMDSPNLSRAIEWLKEQGLPTPHPEATLAGNDLSVSSSPDRPADDLKEATEEMLPFLAPPAAPGEVGIVGRYRVLTLLGAGGMGYVFQARDTSLNRVVALKLMRPGLARSAGKRFLREAQAMAAVVDDHIVRIYEVNEERGVVYLAMECLKGETLEARLKRENRLPLPEVLRIGREIAEGLEAAHAQGLIHRDIKPSNVWLQARGGRAGASATGREPVASATGGCVKILDFGLARAAAQDTGLTFQGVVVGTPTYMAPEQARGEKVDGRSDLFSLGVILYRLCSGRPAFAGPDAISILKAVALEQPPSPRVANPEVPVELSDLVMQLLEKAPERRPASAAVVVEALQALERKLLGVQEGREPKQPLQPPQHRAGPAMRGRLLTVLGSLALLAGLVGAGLWAGGVFRFQTERGELVLESDDPDFAFSPVQDGDVTLQDRKAKRTYRLKVLPLGQDRYQLAVLDKDADLVFHTEKFTVKRGDRVALEAWFERKAAATPAPPQGLRPAASLPASENAWLQQVAALPPQMQVEAVVARLKERNPGFDGKLTRRIEGGVVTELRFCTDAVEDIAPVRALRGLRALKCKGSLQGKRGLGRLSDLSPLAGMNLTCLHVANTKVSDLTPLAGLPLTELDIEFTGVSDLSPLRGMKLTSLKCFAAPVSDLSPLAGMPLTHLSVYNTKVSDLSPLKGMKLAHFNCQGTAVTDLSPLAGMPLTELSCSNTKVSDLSPLVGMRLTWLSCHAARVTDLSPVKAMPLKWLICDFHPERDTAILRAIETLEKINGKPAAEFWKQVPPRPRMP